MKLFSKRNRVLLHELTVTDFKLRYQQSALGYLWSILKPLMLFAVMYIVFAKFLAMGGDIPNYAVYLLAGISFWTFFAEATTQGLQAIVSRGDLIRKINFPKYIIVLSGTISALINLFFNLLVVLVFALLTGVKFRWTVLLLPLNILEMYLLALGIGLMLGSLFVKYRDVGYLWEVALQLFFYGTPIIYPITMVSATHPFMAKLMMLSPMAQVIQDIRYNLVTDYTQTLWFMWGTPLIGLVPLGIVLVVLAFGAWYFGKSSKKFAEVM